MPVNLLSAVLLATLAALLLWAAVTDLRSRIISNRLNAAIALLAPVYWLSLGLSPWPEMAIQLAIGLLVLMMFATLFAMGMMGGGDVKMLGAIALWLPWTTLLWLLLLMTLIGGVVTLAAVGHHHLSRRMGRVETPYGVAIALAGLWVIAEPYFKQFA